MTSPKKLTLACAVLATSFNACASADMLPSTQVYFPILALHQTCQRGPVAASAGMSAYKQQVLAFYTRQLASGDAAKRAAATTAIAQVESDSIPKPELERLAASHRKASAAQRKSICANLDQIAHTQRSLGELAMAELSGNPDQLKAAVGNGAATIQDNSRHIQANLPAISAAMAGEKAAPAPAKQAAEKRR